VSLVDNIKSYSEKENLSSDKSKLLKSFLKKGFPTIKDEEWKYTSIKKEISKDYFVEVKGDRVSKNEIEEHTLGFENLVVLSDGKLIQKPNINGVEISGFSEFNSEINDSISELNSSLSHSGVTIKIKKNTIVENPIEILFFNISKNNFSQNRNRIIISKNAEVKFVEKIISTHDNHSFLNNFTQIDCAENSKIEYNKIQNNSVNSCLIDRIDVNQKKDSVSDINTLIFGGGFVRNNLNFQQNGSNSESNLNGVSVLSGNQIADNHTFVDHKTANCRSNELYKGIYLDDSKGVFNGKIMVRQNSQKIDAFQANNNLLISETATIDSKPQLEIYADDVKCSHGCTIGQLDNEALFYMRSRGIATEKAKAILTYAFASEAIENISIPEVRRVAKKLLSQKLNVDLDFSL
jgi:Fe-S cluster assembly protein SufD